MRRCLKGLGGFPTSTDGFILGPSHGLVGRLAFLFCTDFAADLPGANPAGASAPSIELSLFPC